MLPCRQLGINPPPGVQHISSPAPTTYRLPLVKAVEEDQATACGDKAPEGRLLCHRLAAGVELRAGGELQEGGGRAQCTRLDWLSDHASTCILRLSAQCLVFLQPCIFRLRAQCLVLLQLQLAACDWNWLIVGSPFGRSRACLLSW